MRLTPAQRAALCLAVRHGGSLTKGGMDCSGVRADVLDRLRAAGLLRWQAGGFFSDEYVLTDAGKAALCQQQETRA